MRKITIIILTIAIGLLIVAARNAHAQNPVQVVFDSAVKNGAVGGGFWRATTGNHNIASYDYLYALTTQPNGLGAGLIVGGDCMFGGGSSAQWNDVKGGFAIKYQFNLGAIGFTNTVLEVYGGTAVATPRSPAVGVGNITFVGLDYRLKLYQRIYFHIDPAYQTRTGQGEFDGNYLGIQAFFSLGDGGASMVALDERTRIAMREPSWVTE
jgi:hypothetical protein